MAFLGVPDALSRQGLADLAARNGIDSAVIQGILHPVDGIPTTRARLSHAYKLRTARGHDIGAVYKADVRQTRPVELKRQICRNNRGQAFDLVPGPMTAQTFAIARFDLYTEVFEEVFGGAELSILADQSRGWRLRELWRAPSQILNAGPRRYDYAPCMFTDLGREVATDNDRVVRVNATLVWLDRERIS